MSRALLIAGTQSGVGKTTVTMGLLAALSKRLCVQAYKSGPDYIDPAYHTFITGRKSRNLDNFLMTNQAVTELFEKHIQDADIGIIEGAMGLYDGSIEDPKRGSAASISKAIQCPVVLVVDGRGMAMSAAAMIKGFCDFDADVSLLGVIFNRVNTQSHYDLLKKSVESNTKVKCFGYIPNTLPNIPSRHLGLVSSFEIENLKEKVELMREIFEETIDIDGLIELSSIRNHKQWNQVRQTRPDKLFQGIRVGVAYDEAFSFYYEDNLDLFKEQGAEIVYFSPIRDTELPDGLHFLYFGGGYPEQYAKELAVNLGIKKSIVEMLESGIPYFAECGGLMYLCKTLKDFDGNTYEMLGWLPGTTSMTNRLKRFGYKTLELKQDCVLGPKGLQIKVHEFHHSEVEGMGEAILYELKKVGMDQQVRVETCGYIKGNGVAGYPHLHFYGNKEIAKNILFAASQFKKNHEEYL